MNNFNDMWIAGLPVQELIENYNISKKDLMPYLPISSEELSSTNIQIHYLGYYLKWVPQEAYYYAVENSGFKARPFRSQGTYGKYQSIDDKIDDLHWYTTYIKFGLGRASYDASQEIRNNHIDREEAIALVNKFDGEFQKNILKRQWTILTLARMIFIDFATNLDLLIFGNLLMENGN